MPYLPLRDHRVFYTRAGSGPPLVLLHHATGTHNDWRAQIPLLMATGYTVVAYDRHGFGRSDPLPAWSLDYHDHSVAELIEVLDALALARVALVGHSDGATIALMTAARYPERVVAVVAEAPHMWIEPDWLESGFETFRDTVGASPRFWRAMEREHGERSREVVERWWRRWLDPAFRSWDVSACLPWVRCPVLVVHGAGDIFFPLSHSEAIAARLVQAELRLIPNAGHTPHLEAPTEFNGYLLAFLQRWYPPIMAEARKGPKDG